MDKWEFQQWDRKYKIVPNKCHRAEHSELKYSVEEFNSKLNQAEEMTSEFNDKAVGFTQTKQQKNNNNSNNEIEKSKVSLRELWDIKQTNIHIIGVSDGTSEEKGGENLKKLWLKTSLTWGRMYRFRNSRDFQKRLTQKPTPRHIKS